MRCASCGFENREGVRFCEECGGNLEEICPACGAAVPPGRKFCGGCGQALGTSATRVIAPSKLEVATSRFRAPASYIPQHLAEKILTSKSALEGERACGSAACGAGGVMAWERGRGEGARGRGGR
jgi:hypothetical protein